MSHSNIFAVLAENNSKKKKNQTKQIKQEIIENHGEINSEQLNENDEGFRSQTNRKQKERKSNKLQNSKIQEENCFFLKDGKLNIRDKSDKDIPVLSSCRINTEENTILNSTFNQDLELFSQSHPSILFKTNKKERETENGEDKELLFSYLFDLPQIFQTVDFYYSLCQFLGLKERIALRSTCKEINDIFYLNKPDVSKFRYQLLFILLSPFSFFMLQSR